MTDSTLEQTALNDIQPAQPAEKMVPQSKVNELIGTGYHKGYQKALAELTQTSQAPQAPAVGMGGMSSDDIRKAVAEEMHKHLQSQQEQTLKAQQEAEGKRIMQEIHGKVTEASSRIPDFEDVTSKVDWREIPEVLHYANQPGIATGDVIYDLAKNPSKIATLRSLPPTLAVNELRKLSNSIQTNMAATQTNAPPEPLGQIKPSNVGVGNGGKPTVRDYKRIFRG